jgi:hypothetical protein
LFQEHAEGSGATNEWAAKLLGERCVNNSESVGELKDKRGGCARGVERLGAWAMAPPPFVVCLEEQSAGKVMDAACCVAVRFRGSRSAAEKAVSIFPHPNNPKPGRQGLKMYAANSQWKGIK